MRQAQVIEPAGVVEGAGVGAPGAGADQVLAENALRMLAAEDHRIGARGELQQRMQAAGEMVVAALPEIFEMVFGKVILHRQQLVGGRWLSAFRRGQCRAERAAFQDVPTRQLGARIQPAEELQRCGVLDEVIHEAWGEGGSCRNSKQFSRPSYNC